MLCIQTAESMFRKGVPRPPAKQYEEACSELIGRMMQWGEASFILRDVDIAETSALIGRPLPEAFNPLSTFRITVQEIPG